jgi:hypothetical protein
VALLDYAVVKTDNLSEFTKWYASLSLFTGHGVVGISVVMIINA